MTQEFKVKAGLAQMLKGGVIMDVVTPEQAKIAEKAGACAVMALERIPADMRASGQVCRMSDPKMIKEIMATVSIPVMAKCRIGHFVEAQILEALEVDYIDESEVLTPADKLYHIKKDQFKVPFVCGARNLGEALRRVSEGAAMLRTKGEAGTGDISEAVSHINLIKQQIDHALSLKSEAEVAAYAEELRVPLITLQELIANKGKFPVVNFAAGGVATPADAALCMQLGCDGVFVGSGIFKSKNPELLAKAIVNAVTHYDDPKKVMEYSTDLGELMFGVSVDSLKASEKVSTRGW
ncbi:DEHA2F01364p [Debaryomyces hansenii CBS767]|uniref:pyridoxal 5'-phosphate synthase (glutamine hydrolyzing) n=1 Tax=Debaryomyces hansenii (strain ATCC 36239 / CBS 767 / BCRC 21394 / JCM 1990 / NBRC 0083 / IGC 2968) TaxID=284592 RepID=Q6BMZ8_DEBHA|nr:DEHA2F01364p [Debaryomyces hansenii CBS767]CAG88726.1 DEHA2F01364p [Debaryomyces hansenii CBS767]|eukprot:XP_460422.1 DEHA2F01364p [Debaryomyces hansenii CBS767]